MVMTRSPHTGARSGARSGAHTDFTPSPYDTDSLKLKVCVYLTSEQSPQVPCGLGAILSFVLNAELLWCRLANVSAAPLINWSLQ